MNMTAIAIVAIICWAIVEITGNGKDRKKNKADKQRADTLQTEVSELRERVEVLEKIVTDEKYSLHKEFDALNKDKVA